MAPIMGTHGDSKERCGNTILFNCSKNEVMKLNEQYRALHRRLKGNWKILINKDEITNEVLINVDLFIIPGPRGKFTENEFNCMKRFMEAGGSILVLMGEGGEKKYHTNINFLLEEFGIMVNRDVVVRTHYFRYFDPKECYVVDGVVNRAVSQACLTSSSHHFDYQNPPSVPFVYPYGASLNVARPAITLLSSGSIAFPMNRPVCAVYCAKGLGNEQKGGKLGVIGSVHFLADQYIEENDKLRDVIFKYLTTTEVKLHQIDADDPELSDSNLSIMVPDTSVLAERPRVCLQEPTDDVPTDYLKLFKRRLNSIHTNNVPSAVKAYSLLKVKHEPLRLITPQFETPLPLLQAAVFPPSFEDLPPPPLELFDLDDAFSSDKCRLSQLANKCLNLCVEDDTPEVVDSDLDYFVRESAQILNVSIPGIADPDGKHILFHMGSKLAEFKKLSHHV